MSFEYPDASSGKGTPGFGVVLTDQPGKASWPIAGASFILMYAKQDKPQNAVEVMKFFDWSFRNGGAMAEELDYVAIPDALAKQIADTWKANVKDASGKALWN